MLEHDSLSVSWSPDGSMIALNFDVRSSSNTIERLWQIYDVKTGDLLHEHHFSEPIESYRLIAGLRWFADSTRLLFWSNTDELPHIMDARTGSTIATLQDAGLQFPIDNVSEPTFIEDVIISRDGAGTLHIYDSQTALCDALIFSL